MNLSETRNRILEDEDFVISELQKVQTLYELKKVIRYNHTRQNEQHTESVAEHIFGMHCLIDYFLPLENDNNGWDSEKIRVMAQYHDIDEVITGDIVGYKKSISEQAQERTASEEVINRLPELLQEKVRLVLDEYELKATPEAKFVKAIDKIEPVFHLYNKTGKDTLSYLKTTKNQHDRIKYPYVNGFPIIKRFVDVMTLQFEKEGFYHREA